MSIAIRELSEIDELAVLEPLWLALHRHHRSIGPPGLLVDDDNLSWRRRRALYERWMRAGTAIVLVAERAGYVVAHLCEGPDDTFAIADRYAELYSLSVAPAHRRQSVGTALLDALDSRLAALEIRDVAVAVMAGNDEALQLYRARGFTPAEVSLWRIGRSCV